MFLFLPTLMMHNCTHDFYSIFSPSYGRGWDGEIHTILTGTSTLVPNDAEWETKIANSRCQCRPEVLRFVREDGETTEKRKAKHKKKRKRIKKHKMGISYIFQLLLSSMVFCLCVGFHNNMQRPIKWNRAFLFVCSCVVCVLCTYVFPGKLDPNEGCGRWKNVFSEITHKMWMLRWKMEIELFSYNNLNIWNSNVCVIVFN